MEVSLQSFKQRFTYNPKKDLLGTGGFSQVYKAYDNEDKIFVALKIYQGDPTSKYNLINEVKRFKKLRHPNIVEHIEAYEVNTGSQDIHGNPVQYQVGILEYADGGTLADLLKKGKPEYRLLEDLAKDIVEGLAYLHTNNIIHRDLKPSNILLFNEYGKLRAKITDFGIAKITDATAASTQLVGTVEYMAPEFFKTDSAEITYSADLWSLGVILLEAITGTHPFGKTGTGSTSEKIIHNILFVNPAEAENFSSMPEPFKTIITNCLRREPNLRPNSAADLKHYFNPQDVFSERTRVIIRPKIETKSPDWSKRKKILVAFVSLFSIGLIGFLISINLEIFNHRPVETISQDELPTLPKGYTPVVSSEIIATPQNKFEADDTTLAAAPSEPEKPNVKHKLKDEGGEKFIPVSAEKISQVHLMLGAIRSHLPCTVDYTKYYSKDYGSNQTTASDISFDGRFIQYSIYSTALSTNHYIQKKIEINILKIEIRNIDGNRAEIVFNSADILTICNVSASEFETLKNIVDGF